MVDLINIFIFHCISQEIINNEFPGNWQFQTAFQASTLMFVRYQWKLTPDK